PEWTVEAHEYFDLLVAGGPSWTSLVQLWQVFESHMGYLGLKDEQNRLSPIERPEEIGAWMKDGRSYEKLPLVDPVDFALRWQAWWCSLQPPCRRSGTVSTWPLVRTEPTDPADWDLVWRAGPCGLFLIVMGLGWW
ncbi:hypothetical protein C8Q80DRAFT_1073875, partial [Daedaleopsis nitida]